MIFSKIYFFLKKHYLILFFALLVGTVSVLPQFLAIRAIGGDYEGIHFMYTANEDVYMARIQEIIDGHWGVGSAFFYEYKNWKTLMPPTGEYFYAIPAILLGVSLPSVLIASKFLFPAILFFLVYLLILKLSNDSNSLGVKLNAVVGGLFITLGYDLVDFKTTWLFLNSKITTTNLLLWTRPVNPITGALLVFIFLLLLWKIINGGRRWWSLPTGLTWSLMVGYFFSWSLSLAVMTVLLAIFILKKNYRVVKNLLLICFVFFLVGLPYWLNILNSLGSTDGRARAAKNGMFFTHTPVVNKVLLVISLIFLAVLAYEYFATKKLKQDNWRWFCVALIGAGWLAFNQQIITGRTIWYHHFVQYTIPFSIVVGMVLWARYLKPRFFKIWLAGVILLIFAIIVFNVRALKSHVAYYDSFKELQKDAAIFSWLNKIAPKDCVVLVERSGSQQDFPLELLLAGFTHCNTYFTNWIFDGVPEERVKHNFLVMLRMRGVDPSVVKMYLEQHETEVRAYFFNDWNQFFGQGFDPAIQKTIDKLVTEYNDFYKKNLVAELEKYKLDYILFVNPPTSSTINMLPRIKPLYNYNNFYIYKF